MATFDLVGIPFPKTAPLFSDDAPILKRIGHIEDLIEIFNELSGLKYQLQSAQKLIGADQTKLFEIVGMPLHLVEGLTIGCVVTYAKSFQSSARVMLQSSQIFKDNPLSQMHEFLMTLRNKWYSHQELVGDQHHLFLFQDPQNSSIRFNPFGQHHHVLVSHGLDWNSFESCADLCINYVRSSIEQACESLRCALSPEQIEFINALDKDRAIAIYWNQQPHNRRSPFTSRGA